ncbi:hypothetical protein BDR03DRAFT_976604 [Suillus americanus]|nr:hypothetical protein BDR03DRAFT_976604 [Suillus americanus]
MTRMLPPLQRNYSSSSADTQTMHFSFLAVIVALTASMSVSACYTHGIACQTNTDCCTNQNLVCSPTAVGVAFFASSFHLVTRLLCFIKSEIRPNLHL